MLSPNRTEHFYVTDSEIIVAYYRDLGHESNFFCFIQIVYRTTLADRASLSHKHHSVIIA